MISGGKNLVLLINWLIHYTEVRWWQHHAMGVIVGDRDGETSDNCG